MQYSRRRTIWLVTALLCLLALPAFAAPTKLSNDELERILAPIALFPDSLLGNILTAATKPDEVIEADAWIAKHSDLDASKIMDACKSETWDPSVKALLLVPETLAQMVNNMVWTEQLGQAFANQQSDVADAIQSLRKKAKKSGALQSTKDVKVVTDNNGTISIGNTNPDVIVVPRYSPTVVYATTPTYAYDSSLAIIWGCALIADCIWYSTVWDWGNRYYWIGPGYYGCGYWGGCFRPWGPRSVVPPPFRHGPPPPPHHIDGYHPPHHHPPHDHHHHNPPPHHDHHNPPPHHDHHGGPPSAPPRGHAAAHPAPNSPTNHDYHGSRQNNSPASRQRSAQQNHPFRPSPESSGRNETNAQSAKPEKPAGPVTPNDKSPNQLQPPAPNGANAQQPGQPEQHHPDAKKPDGHQHQANVRQPHEGDVKPNGNANSSSSHDVHTSRDKGISGERRPNDDSKQQSPGRSPGRSPRPEITAVSHPSTIEVGSTSGKTSAASSNDKVRSDSYKARTTSRENRSYSPSSSRRSSTRSSSRRSFGGSRRHGRR